MEITKVTGLSALLLSVAVGGVGQTGKIADSVKRAKMGKPVVQVRSVDLPPTPFDEMVRESALIVTAEVRNPSAVLSNDGNDLFTDYEMARVSLIAGAVPKQGGAQQAILRQWGGDATLDGVDVHIHDGDFPTLPTGQPLLLFLTFDPSTARYSVYGGGNGAFVLKPNGGPLKPVRKGGQLRNLPSDEATFDELVSEIRRLGR